MYLKETDASQGDLSDPKYFDFISAAQIATITREMRTGRLIFEELTGAEGTKEVVSRGPSSPQNNDLLPWALYKGAGEAIYAGVLSCLPSKLSPPLCHFVCLSLCFCPCLCLYIYIYLSLWLYLHFFWQSGP